MMELNGADFFIGFFLMNAMPHMLFGLIRLRFLSLFGFSEKGNLLYGLVNVAAATGLYHYQYGINAMKNDGIMVGALTIIVIYAFTGRFLAGYFQAAHEPVIPDHFEDE